MIDPEINKRNFLGKYIGVCKKYGVCLAPSYEGSVSLHDPMYVVELDGDLENYIENRIYYK